MLRFACHSDPGRQHQVNQDRWFADAETGIFLVTDGMANDIAPQVVVDVLPDALAEIVRQGNLNDASLNELLQSRLQNLSAQVYDAMAQAGEIGLGATLVLVLDRESKCLIAHLGDSRAYLFRDGEITQLTIDHSVVQRLLELGSITEEEAKNARGNGGPTRFLGQVDPIQADVKALEFRDGDRLLLCSDGLTEMLRDEEIAKVLESGGSCEEFCKRLVDAANDAGGRDNVTAMVIDVGRI